MSFRAWELGRVFREACARVRAWRSSGIRHVYQGRPMQKVVASFEHWLRERACTERSSSRPILREVAHMGAGVAADELGSTHLSFQESRP
jgi:hypothetical protein